jgi:hypothetical protein
MPIDGWHSWAQLYVTALDESHEKAFADFMASLAMPPTAADCELAGSGVMEEIRARQKAGGSSEFGMRHELISCS